MKIIFSYQRGYLRVEIASVDKRRILSAGPQVALHRIPLSPLPRMDKGEQIVHPGIPVTFFQNAICSGIPVKRQARERRIEIPVWRESSTAVR